MKENKDKKEYLKSYRALDRRAKEIGGYLASEQEGLLKKKLECEIKKSEIMAAIHRIGNTEEEEVLELRYIQGRSWEYICAKMNYGKTKVFEMHRDALRKVKCNAKAGLGSANILCY